MSSTTAISAQNQRTLHRILRTLKVTPAVMTAWEGNGDNSVDSSDVLLRFVLPAQTRMVRAALIQAQVAAEVVAEDALIVSLGCAEEQQRYHGHAVAA